MINETEFSLMNQEKKYVIWIKVLVLVAITAIVIVALLREKIVNDAENTVIITGHGKVSYQPNTATVTLGAQISNVATSGQALDSLNQKVSQIINAVISQGIAREDIATKNYSLNPHYDYADGKSTVSGYDANQQIEIKVKDIGNNQQKVSNILTAAGNAGSNDVKNVSFDIDNQTDLLQQAKIAAINDARKKSQDLANAAGVKLGKVISWQDHQSSGTYQPMAQLNGLGDTIDKSIASADVPAGTKDVVVDVDVKFEVE